MRPRGIIKDLLLLFIGFHIIKNWITGEPITTLIGVGTLLFMALAAWFLLERFKL